MFWTTRTLSSKPYIWLCKGGSWRKSSISQIHEQFPRLENAERLPCTEAMRLKTEYWKWIAGNYLLHLTLKTHSRLWVRWALKGCTVPHGCCFFVWGRVRNYLAQCFKSQWLIPDDSIGLSKLFRHLENNLPDYWVMHLFLSKVCWCLRKQILSVLSLLAFEPSFVDFYNLHPLKKNSTDKNYTLREKMSPFAFNFLLADARVLSRLYSHYLFPILPFMVWISFLPFSRILMAFSLSEILYRVSYFGKIVFQGNKCFLYLTIKTHFGILLLLPIVWWSWYDETMMKMP